MSAPDLRPRTVTLVLCTGGGEVVGVLPPFETPVPWWPEARDIVAAAQARHGVDVTILRLLLTQEPVAGGPVTYLAQLADGSSPRPGDATAWTGPDPIAEHALRLPWARPGGPAAELAWARDALRDAGRRPTTAPEQMRTWNLSSIWRIPTDRGDAWLKSIPPFFAHEGPMIAYLAGLSSARGQSGLTPPLIAHDRGRVLMADVPGKDQYDAAPALLITMVDSLVRLQAEVAARHDLHSLLAMGLPDWRRDPLRRRAEHVLERHRDELGRDELGRDERSGLDQLLARWDDRFAAIEECGLPDTLVHGDFHPGNVRGEPGRLAILDWGDSGVGHPMLDQPAMLDRAPDAARAALVDHWAGRWRVVIPGSDPGRAAALLRPVAAMRQASIYQSFLDAIEPDERVYHVADPLAWLRRAASIAADG